jgi:hypothetical protein
VVTRSERVPGGVPGIIPVTGVVFTAFLILATGTVSGSVTEPVGADAGSFTTSKLSGRAWGCTSSQAGSLIRPVTAVIHSIADPVVFDAFTIHALEHVTGTSILTVFLI